MSSKADILIVAAVLAGCGPVIRPVNVTSSPPPKEVAKARWVFSTPFDPLARLPLSDGVLLAGKHGRRRLGVLEADSIFPKDVLAIQRAPDGRFVFVMTNGRLALTASALGPVLETLSGPHLDDVILDATAGAHSLTVIDSTKTTFRSVDSGRTWSALTTFSGLFGPSSVALDREGHGLLLMEPQRLFVTLDDGATWSRLETNGKAPRRVRVDSTGRVGTEGSELGVLALSPPRLEDGKTEPKKPRPPQLIDGPVFAGTRVARVFEQSEHATVRIGALGAAPIEHPLPPGQYWPRSIAGNDHVLWVATSDKGRVGVFRSEDSGASWQPVGRFEEHYLHPDPKRALVPGPDGSLVAIGLTADSKDTDPLVVVLSPKGCVNQRLPKGIHSPRAVAFEGSATWVLDERGGLSKGSTLLREPRPGDPIFDDLTITNGSAWMTHPRGARRLDLEGIERGRIELPEPVVLRFSGARGLAVAKSSAWETYDAGAHFGPVAVSDYGKDFVCRPEGCAFAEGDRIGWDEPAPEVIPPPPTPAPPPPPPKLVVTSCKANGNWQELVQRPTWLEGSRWVGFHAAKNGMVSAVVGTAEGTLSSHALLQKKATEELVLEGALAAQGGVLKTELAWWSESSHAVKKHVVTTDPVYRPRGVDGGVVWDYAGKITLLADGAAEVSLPIEKPWDMRTSFVKAGNDIVTYDLNRMVFWDGKTAKERRWNLPRPVELLEIGHRPFAGVQLDSEHPWLLPLDNPTVDPPDPILLSADAACTDDDGRLFRVKGSDRAFSIAYDVLPHVYRNVDRLLLVHRNGTACLRGYVHDTLMIFTSKTTTGWVMERLGNEYGGEPRPVRIRPLTCP